MSLLEISSASGLSRHGRGQEFIEPNRRHREVDFTPSLLQRIGNLVVHGAGSRISILGSAAIDTVVGTIHDIRHRREYLEQELEQVLPLVYEDPDQAPEQEAA